LALVPHLIYFIHFLYFTFFMKFPAHLRWLWLTLAVIFLDRASKAWIESHPVYLSPQTVIPGYFDIIYSRNPGIAFSYFADSPPATTRYLVIFGSIAIIAVIAWLLVATKHLSSLSAAGLALLLAGATGNVTDRIIHGAVTDFLQVWLKFVPLQIFNPWPTFNVADAAVTIGAILLVCDVLFGTQQPSKHT
jgi:signal peptidase II